MQTVKDELSPNKRKSDETDTPNSTKKRKTLTQESIPMRPVTASYSYIDSDFELINQVRSIERFGTYEQKKYLEFGIF